MYNTATDSVLRILMHRSDNFYAEQTLLMVANKINARLNDRQVMDTVINTLGFAQKPKWVDGSGLSRYNANTPENFVNMLIAMQKLAGMPRLQNILAGANEGTLENYYKPLAGKIFAKTGTLSGTVALSGYLTTKTNTQLVFSILVNNHNNSATAIRRAVEKYLMNMYDNY
jgi:serine-type D-Ala-D-Ala carboxypeptidase/endopeptidase (penicillin-binding protein 4)